MRIWKQTIAVLTTLLLSAGLAANAQAKKDMVVPPMPENVIQGDRLSFDPGAGVATSKSRWAVVDGRKVLVHKHEGFHTGYMLPDGNGGYIWVTSEQPVQPPRSANEEARELKLKVRELADQLFNGAGEMLRGVVAMPTSFVNQDNLDETSSLGRSIAEQMFYEMSQRGIAVRDVRADVAMTLRKGQGEFLLTRRYETLDVANPYAVVLVGTYYTDADNLTINARLVRGSDGMVLRTGMLVMPQTMTTRAMLAQSGMRLEATYVGLKDFKTMTEDANITSIDLGEDLH